MFCPNLSNPEIKSQFEKLNSIVPEYVYYLWNQYRGEVPKKFYDLYNIRAAKEEIIKNQLTEAGFSDEDISNVIERSRNMESPIVVFKGIDGKFDLSSNQINIHSGIKGFFTSQSFKTAKQYDKGSGVAVYLFEAKNAIKDATLSEEEMNSLTMEEARNLEILKINELDFSGTGLVQFRTIDLNGEDVQFVVKNASINDNIATVKENKVFFEKKNNNQIKPGVSELFESNPELASIGTAEQYSQYLDSIFPESKVKNIVYHGTPDGRFDSFDVNKAGKATSQPTQGVYFTDSKKTADFYAEGSVDFSQFESLEEYEALKTAKVFQVILDAKDLKLVDNPQAQERQGNSILRTKEKIADNGLVGDLDYAHQYIVFNPEQIHILGNKQDIEGFKQFVSSSKMYSKQTNLDIEKRVISEYFKKEKVANVMMEIIMDKDYDNLTPTEKQKYILNKIIDKEIKPMVERRTSMEMLPNGSVLITPSQKFLQTNNRYSVAQFTMYVDSTVSELNNIYFGTKEPIIGKATELRNGNYVMDLSYEGSNKKRLEQFVDFIDNLKDDIDWEYIKLDLDEEDKISQERKDNIINQVRLQVNNELTASHIQEALAFDHPGIADRFIEANEFVYGGEVYPINGSLLKSRAEITYLTKNPEFEKYTKILNFLSSKFPGVSWEWNTNINNAGEVDIATGRILINPNLMKPDTPWHEFGHIIIRSIRLNNPELFEELKNDIKKLHEETPYMSSYSIVRKFYPEYGLSDLFWEEAITTELGNQAAEKVENNSILQKVINFFKELFGFNITPKTSISNLVDQLLSPEEIKIINDEYSQEYVNYMYSRVIPPGTETLMENVLKDIDGDGFKFKSFNDKVKSFSSQIEDNDIKIILNSNKFLGTSSKLLNDSINQIKRIRAYVTKEDVASAFIEMSDYIQTSNFYLKSVEQRLKTVVYDETGKYSPSKILNTLYFAQKQAYAYKQQIKVIEELLTRSAKNQISATERDVIKDRNKNPLLYQLAAIKYTISLIENNYIERVAEPVANELYRFIEVTNKELEDSYNQRIETVRKGKRSKESKDKLIKKIEKERNEKVLTRDKIKDLLTNDTNLIYSSMESAMMTQNPTIQLIAQYIKEAENEAVGLAIKEKNKLQTIHDKIVDEAGPLSNAVINPASIYKEYTRVADYFYVEGGELKQMKVLVLNTQTKTVELQNKITKLKYDLLNATTEEKKVDLEDQIEEFYKKYTERPFTEEYYEINEALPKEIRKQRQLIYSKINEERSKLEIGLEGDIYISTVDVVARIQELNKELDDMERLYDEKGNKKTGKALEVAEAIINWKKNKKAKEMVKYELTDASKLAFQNELSRRVKQRDLLLASAKTEVEEEAAKADFDAWASLNLRTTYTQEFYDKREDIISKIDAIVSKNSNKRLTDLYDELFNILKGNKDASGTYIPSNYSQEILLKSKEIEEEIENLKALIKENSPLDKASKDQLSFLFKQLNDLQVPKVSSYYTQVSEDIQSEIRMDILTKNPDMTEAVLEREVYKAYVNSDWYKNNHISKSRYDSDLKQVVQVNEPIFVWRVTRPKDEKYVEKNQPSFNWYTAKIDANYVNPKYIQGQIQFKEVTSGEYYNKNFDTLSSKKKQLLKELRDYYNGVQDGLYNADKLHDIIPPLYASSVEEIIDRVSFRKNRIATTFGKLKNLITSSLQSIESVDNAEQAESELNMVDSAGKSHNKSRKLFMKYRKPIPVEEQSYDIMRAISNYSLAAVKFKAMRNIQSTVLAAEDIVSTSGDKTAAKNLPLVIDRAFYGKTLSNENLFDKITNPIGTAFQSRAGQKVLKFNLISTVVNYYTGKKQNLVFLQSHGITSRNYLSGKWDASMATKDWFTHANQLGNKPLSLQLLEYFSTEQKDYFNIGSDINNKGYIKYGSIWNTISTFRDFTEFQIAAEMSYAFLNQYRVKLKGSDKTIPMKDAFILKDGNIELRDDVDTTKEYINAVRRKIYLATRRSQGIYDSMSQPEKSKHTWFRMITFLKKWVIPDLKASFGRQTIHYGAGIVTESSWGSMLKFIKEVVVDYKFINMMSAWEETSQERRGGVAKATINFAAFIIATNALMALTKYTNCEEDGEANIYDYFCFIMKKIVSEIEGITTLHGINEMLFTYVKEQANGVSLADKTFNQLSSPVSIFRGMFTDEEMWSLDPYYRYNKSKVDWDKTHPLYAGKPGLFVLGSEFAGARNLFLDPKSVEFNNRRYNDYAPKTYTKELITRYGKNHEKLEEMAQRKPLAQTRKIFKKQIKKLNEDIRRFNILGNQVKVNELIEERNILVENFQKRMSDINKKGNKQEDINLPFIPKPFFMSRPGLDISQEEISNEEEED